jgi:hypothetical protein
MVPADLGAFEHLVQTQLLYRIASRLSCLSSMKFEADMVLRTATVDRNEAAGSSASKQYAR